MPARFKYFMTRILHGSATRRPFDVSVSPESYSFRLCRVIRSLLETCPLCRLRRHNMTMIKFYPLPSLPTLTKYFICYSVSAFSFYLKKKTPAKEKQTQGFAPRPRERRAAAHSPRLSFSCSAHSPVNSLRSNNTGSCVLLRKPFPRSPKKAFKHCGVAIESLITKIS